MMLGIGLGTVITVQIVGAMALWPQLPAKSKPKKGLKPLREEEENELVRENKELAHRLADVTRDRKRLSDNGAAAIEKRDEYEAERNELKIRCDDLLKECKRIRKASIRTEAGSDDKKD